MCAGCPAPGRSPVTTRTPALTTAVSPGWGRVFTPNTATRDDQNLCTLIDYLARRGAAPGPPQALRRRQPLHPGAPATRQATANTPRSRGPASATATTSHHRRRPHRRRRDLRLGRHLPLRRRRVMRIPGWRADAARSLGAVDARRPWTAATPAPQATTAPTWTAHRRAGPPGARR